MNERFSSGRMASRRTLIGDINNIADIYGFRNRFYMPNFSDRTSWLLMGAKDLFEVVRKDKSYVTQQLVVARVFARIDAVDEYFRSADDKHLPFVKMLCQKYPLKGCSYCKNKPCKCPSDRRQSSVLDASDLAIQKKWSLDDWQMQLAEVYAGVNAKSSWDRMFAHLMTEIVEIVHLSQNTSKFKQEVLIQNFAKELADTFAWTRGVATKMKVSIGEAVELVYGNGCGSCLQPQCNCDAHAFDFLDIDAFEALYCQGGELANTMISSQGRLES